MQIEGEVKRLRKKLGKYRELVKQKQEEISLLNRRVDFLAIRQGISKVPSQFITPPRSEQPSQQTLANQPTIRRADSEEPQILSRQQNQLVKQEEVRPERPQLARFQSQPERQVREKEISPPSPTNRTILQRQLLGMMEQWQSKIQSSLKFDVKELVEQLERINVKAIRECRQEACCHSEQSLVLKAKLQKLQFEHKELIQNFNYYRSDTEEREKQLVEQVSELKEEMLNMSTVKEKLLAQINKYKRDFNAIYEKNIGYTRERGSLACSCGEEARNFCQIDDCESPFLCKNCFKGHQHRVSEDIGLIFSKLRSKFKEEDVSELIDCCDHYCFRLKEIVRECVAQRISEFYSEVYSNFYQSFSDSMVRLLLDLLTDQFGRCSRAEMRTLIQLAHSESLQFVQKKDKTVAKIKEKEGELGGLFEKLIRSPFMSVYFRIGEVDFEEFRLQSGEISSNILSKKQLIHIVELFKARRDSTVVSTASLICANVSDGIDIGQIHKVASEKESLLYVIQKKGGQVLVCYVRPRFREELWHKTKDPQGESFIYDMNGKNFLSTVKGKTVVIFEQDRFIIGNYDLVILDQFKYWAKFEGNGGYTRLGRECSSFENEGLEKEALRTRYFGEQIQLDRWERCDRHFFKLERLQILKLGFLYK